MPGSTSPTDLPASLTLEVDGPVAIVRLCRPRKRNALDDATVLGLEQIFSSPPDGVGAIVLDAEGDHFSAGLDLNDLTARDTVASIEHSMMWHRAFDRIELGRVPVVAVLHGAVIGGGLELASSTHVRVAEQSTFYALPEGQRGLFVGGGGSVRIPRLIGAHRMADLMLTGRVYDAAEGQALGLSHYLVDDGAGLSRGLELARRIAENAPVTNFALIQALPRIAESNPRDGFFTEALIAAIASGSDEAKARMAAFLDGRTGKVGK